MFRASVPVKLPFMSTTTLPTPAAGTAPDGRTRVPLMVNPQVPATVAVEQYAACAAGDRLARSAMKQMSVNVVLAALCFMIALICGSGFPLRKVCIALSGNGLIGTRPDELPGRIACLH